MSRGGDAAGGRAVDSRTGRWNPADNYWLFWEIIEVGRTAASRKSAKEGNVGMVVSGKSYKKLDLEPIPEERCRKQTAIWTWVNI